jgi:hypothetical protein
MMNKIFSFRMARAAVAGLVVAGLGACSTFDEILEVQNPDELQEELLQDVALVNVLVASVKGDFDEALDDPFIWRGSMFTDETLTGINWEQTARLNQRIVQYDEGDADLMFSELSAARQQADSIAVRLQSLLESPSTDERMAKVLAYAGYSYILLADAMCGATVNVGSQIYQPLELYQFAVDNFDRALPIATAAGADDLVDLVHVGLSRAHLNLGNYGDVATNAMAVTPGFVYYADYSDENPAVYNVLESRVVGVNHSLGVHPKWVPGGSIDPTNPDLAAQLTDPRIQHLSTWRLGHNQLTPLYTPFASLMMSNYNGEDIASGGSPASIERDSSIGFASQLEALHNMHEATLASGGAEAAALAFVNARQAFGNQTVDAGLTGQALVDELRNQRGRDLFLAGHRLGDLRRWLRDGDDLFPSGTHTNAQWGDYGTATCYPLPLEEYEGNPNITDPN